MTDCVRITQCRLCDSPDLELIISFTPTPPGDQYLREPRPQPCYPLDLMSCRSCGAVQLADTVDPALIYTDYLYTTSISPGLGQHFNQYAASVLERVAQASGSLVVDIGSNDGTLLRAFQRFGHRVRGIDPASAIAAQASAAGIPTTCAWFTTETARAFREAYGPAAVVTANHVMANVADLHDFIEGVKELLAPNGTFVFETGYWPAIASGNLVDTIEHEHIHYFAVVPLVQFFARHGLDLVAVEKQPTKGGSLRGYVRHLGEPLLDDSVGRFMREECAHAIDLVAKADEWNDHPQLVAMEGQRIVGYGSAVGSTMLCHHFGYGNVLKELWDDNTTRHGMFSPGFHLPVVPPNSSTPDRIVILAWRYAEMIMAAHPEHKGKWIIPLPTLRFA